MSGGDGDGFFCLLYSVHVDLLRRTSSGALPRDDAGQIDSSRIGPKKRLAYETGTERRLRGQRTPDFAPWHREMTLQAPTYIVHLEIRHLWSFVGWHATARLVWKGRLWQQSGSWKKRKCSRMRLLSRRRRDVTFPVLPSRVFFGGSGRNRSWSLVLGEYANNPTRNDWRGDFGRHTVSGAPKCLTPNEPKP